MPSPRALRARALSLVAILAAFFALAGCGADHPTEHRAPITLPLSVRLSAQERSVWQPLAISRTAIPVLLYHGIGERRDFESPSDAAYGVTQRNFAKQMALLRSAGYKTITLEQFRAFVAGEEVHLPAHPLLLTFDDSLANAFAGADAVLRQLHWNAVMFVDVGSVDEGHDGYASWEQIAAAQGSGRWEMQLHAGRGHHNIVYDAAGTTGPFYANLVLDDEDIGAWQRRVVEDLDWGDAQLAKHVPGYRELSFAPPYGNFGQLATDDPRIPGLLGDWLRKRFGLVFVQDPAQYARPGQAILPRLQITRKMTGGDLHAWLDQQLPSLDERSTLQ
jgi:peptidoglycan/xylan/chitin deacetylase (PgdA/CDA1 family)